MPQTRSIRLRRSHVVWLVAIVVIGVVVGATVGPWWGVGAAVVVLVTSDLTERIQRSRT